VTPYSSPDHRRLDEVIEEVASIDVCVTVCDLDDQSAPAHPRNAVVAGDDVGLDRPIDEGEPVFELCLPELLSPLDEIVAAPDVVDEDVELADPLEQARHLGRNGVVDAHGDALAAARGDDAGSLLNGLRTTLHAWASGHAAAGAVDRRTRFTECGGDPASRSPRRTGDDGDLSCEWPGHAFLRSDGEIRDVNHGSPGRLPDRLQVTTVGCNAVEGGDSPVTEPARYRCRLLEGGEVVALL
jgi:hypothetical protein